jgi:F-type H+-transporting ATPase subunit a
MVYLSITAEKITEIWGFPITNTFLATILVSLIFIGVAIYVSRKACLRPRGFYNFLEALFEMILNFIDSITENRERTRKYVPIVVTLFLFLLVSNLIGVFPIFGPITVEQTTAAGTQTVPLLRTPTSDYTIPFIFALVAVVVLQFYIIFKAGIIFYLRKFLPWDRPRGVKGFGGYVKWFGKTCFDTALGLLGIISEIAKIIALSFRLFGNMLSSEILLTLMMFFIGWVVPTLVLGMSVFFGAIQAMVFSFLVLVFFSMADKEIDELKKHLQAKTAALEQK